jgi:hypothetical protein
VIKKEGYAIEVKTVHRILTYEAELLLPSSLTRKIQNLLWQEPCKGEETDSQAKFDKEL